MSIDACSPIKTSALRKLFVFLNFNLKDVRKVEVVHKSRKSYCGIYSHSTLITWRATRKLRADLRNSEFISFSAASHSRENSCHVSL